MNYTATPACAADDEGRRCTREPVMLRPVALCEPHRIEIALAVVPVVLRDQLAAAQESLTAPAPRSELVATAVAVDVDNLLGGVHDSVVYFLANGGRVKIGYTTNLKSRLGSLALRRSAALLALQGGPELERALHSHFAAYRDGSTEWFELSPEIFRYIAAPHPTATTVAEPVEPVAEPVATDARPADAAALRRAVRRLNRRAVKDTGRPVAIGVLRAELSLSRREATALRREILGEAGS
ncbi:GIY-YIG nuclease family protein [Streptomyces ipomoeae]|uniref:GIY-YIG nuclease family protein n=1 Tax=Streptomyces ipomoeae TaxID=103232 RepID=A0AAE8W9Z8_9ACTN|nr:GIY-YIG nuclease family protein [Streptomyces ipomoeae]TQE40250.1 GIY-YIG nuclease family protein [Streptomyces ipomoeae]